jgi:sialate O-acetylesterase
MVAPIIPFAIKGVIWYQGENNVDRPYQYIKLFPALIKSWRNDWGLGDFPFYYVQLAPYRYKTHMSEASQLREAQSMAMSLPNTGMVVTTDIGDLNDIHPKNKQEVGRRLALWALAKTYGYNDIVYSGPEYTSMNIENDRIRLHFKCTGSGLMKVGDRLRSFEIASLEGKYFPAQAYISDSTVIVYSEKVKDPQAVRYGWDMILEPNLFNNEGLPAVPFRTHPNL